VRSIRAGAPADGYGHPSTAKPYGSTNIRRQCASDWSFNLAGFGWSADWKPVQNRCRINRSALADEIPSRSPDLRLISGPDLSHNFCG
jgi:hypothetical protein